MTEYELPKSVQDKYNITLFNTPYEIDRAIVFKHSAMVLLIAYEGNKIHRIKSDHWIETNGEWQLCKRCK